MSAPRPFSDEEYRGRARRVREEMSQRGVDVLLVLSPPNLNYLTGFESIWYPPRAPVGVIVSSEVDELVFVDYERHRTLVERVALFDDAIFYDYTTVIDQIRSAVRGRGWNGRAIGIERWTQAPGAPLVDEIAAALEAEGGHAVDGDWIVDRVRLVKSEAELECVRRAAEIVDAAFASLLEYVRPGRTELEIAAHLNAAMAALGGEEPAIRTMVSAGPDVWCRTHSPPSRRPVEAGDVMYVDACGVYNRYHVDLCRTFAIGRDDPGARRVLDETAGSVEAVRAAVKPGDPLDVAQRVAEEYVYARFPREQVWWVGGYALGIAMPPNWVGHTYLANDAFETFTWEPGYVTNYENILFDRDGGYTASYMETLLMTESGIEALSKLPRTLTVLGG
ncbi:MAG TPA: Xaa-Pro peptidase family protein [Gaiellales bacterium]|jgi:Xaa-Pro aminopeptidase|nr:Xaa-Pro peptidase family protein [Gaiellales bacterium]